MSENTYFEKQRDLLIQEIGLGLESVTYNLDILNRSLAGSVSVGKEFDDVARLWSHFYDGAAESKKRNNQEVVTESPQKEKNSKQQRSSVNKETVAETESGKDEIEN